MATKAELESELAKLKYDYQNALEQIDQLEKDLDYAEGEAEGVERRARLITDELEELQEKYNSQEIGAITKIQIAGVNTQGEFLATAIAKLLENGRDLETLEMLEAIGEPATRAAFLDWLSVHKLITG